MTALLRFCFRVSKAAHKYLGFLAALYLLLMGASGLLLANPGWIRSLAAPWSIVPDNYSFRNWNRMLVRQGIRSDTGEWYLAGKGGVLHSRDDGASFAPLAKGFPEAAYDRDTSSLLLVEQASGTTLFAATRNGLYVREKEVWRPVELPGAGSAPVVKVLRAGSRVMAFTADQAYAAAIGSDSFAALPLQSSGGEGRSPVPLFRVLHDIHNGTILGRPGKLLTDILAGALIFLTGSGLLLWYLPLHLRRFTAARTSLRAVFRVLWHNHDKIGIYALLFLIISAGSGILLRPPLLIAIAHLDIEAVNPLLALSPRTRGLGGKIQNAVHSTTGDTLILATETGFWQGPADGSGPFTSLSLPLPVHGMGVTVLEEMEPDLFLVGSFLGLYAWRKTDNQVWRLPRPDLREGNPYMSNDLVTGVIMQNGMPRFRLDYHDGMLPITPSPEELVPVMPGGIAAQTPLSLWHYLFEFHNGRIFEKWLGRAYVLLVPMGGLLLMAISLSGFFAWMYRKWGRKKPRQ